MGGLSRVIESGIGRKPSEMKALDALGGLRSWETAVKAITEAHAAAFHEAPFIFTAAKPYRSPAGRDAFERVLNYLVPKHPKHFRIMNCSLTAAQLPGRRLRKNLVKQPQVFVPRLHIGRIWMIPPMMIVRSLIADFKGVWIPKEIWLSDKLSLLKNVYSSRSTVSI